MTPGGTPNAAGSASTAATHVTSESKAATHGRGEAASSSAASSGALKKGPWTPAEDEMLTKYVREYGEGNWNAVQKNTGLSRCGKSCRLRWANHLRPNLKKGSFSPAEERLILELQAKMGNKWAHMAAQMPGRTDNEIKNYWNTRIKRRQRAGLPLYPPDIQRLAALHRRPPSSGPAPSPLFGHKPQFSASTGATPLPLLKPVNFPGLETPGPSTSTLTNPLLLGHLQQFLIPPATPDILHQTAKRHRDDDIGFFLPLNTYPVQPSPSQTPRYQFNPLGNYDVGPLPLPPPPLQQQQQSISMKMELPSSQLYPVPSAAIAGGSADGVRGLPLVRSNSDLLDALLRGTQPEGSSNDGGEHRPIDIFMPEAEAHPAEIQPLPGLVLAPSAKWDDSNRPIDANMKTGPAKAISWTDDDISALLDAFPMATTPTTAPPPNPREWHSVDGGEMSNVRSSAVTDEVGLDMQQQLASSHSMAAEEDHSWKVGPGHRDDTPGPR